MGIKGRGRRRKAGRHRVGVEVTALEGRTLLTPLPLRPAFVPRPAAMAHYREHRLTRGSLAALRSAPPAPDGLPPALAPQEGQPKLEDQVSFAFNTVRDGQRMASSPKVRQVGLDYAKLSVSHDARKVGAAYLDAAIRGDGKDLERLGKSPLVRKVGEDFHRLSESTAVQRVGDAFERFGKSVAREFNRLFGLD